MGAAAGGDDVTVRRVLRVESSPARQITLQQASAVVRGASCGVHAMEINRAGILDGLQEPVAGQMTPQPLGPSGSITPMTPGVPLPMETVPGASRWYCGAATTHDGPPGYATNHWHGAPLAPSCCSWSINILRRHDAVRAVKARQAPNSADGTH